MAEEPSQAFTLDPMVVTATRYEKRDVDVPASTTVLTGQELKDTGANNLGVALSKVPGIAIKDMKKRFGIGDYIPEIQETDIPELAHYRR